MHGDKISGCSPGWPGAYCVGYSEIQRDLPASTHPLPNAEIKDIQYHT